MNTSQKEELQALAEKIREQQLKLITYEGSIPKIELDILLHNYRRSYEILTSLETKIPEPIILPEIDNIPNADHIAKAEVSVVTDIPVEAINEESAPVAPQEEIASVPAPVVQQEVLATIPVPVEHPPMQPELIVSKIETPVIPVTAEPVSEAVIPQAGLQKERTREFVKTSKAVTASLFDETPTIAQQFSSSATVRDRYTGTNDDNSIAEKLQQDPLSDLKKSIGINEKFSFVNELFDGDLSNYNNAIDLLNNCTDLNTAIEILSGKLALQYQWSDEGSSFRQLKNLVTRRFSV